jgi:hypothetical protein
MLEWTSLSLRQQVACTFLAFVCAAGLGVMLLTGPVSLTNILVAIAAACLFLAILLNPSVVQGRSIMLYGKTTPAPCRLLMVAAFGTFLLSRAVAETL